jgi:hypothetical protein
MAIDFVDVNQQAKFGRLLVSIAANLRSVRDDVIAAKERMDHMNGGGNFAPIAVGFGLSPADSATGQAAFNVINDALTALNNASILTMIQRVG